MRCSILVLLTSLFLGCGGVPESTADARSDALSRRGDSIALPGPAYYPEGIAAGPGGTLYVGSIGTGAIVRIPPGSSTPETFLPPRPAFATYGMAVDAPRGLLWVCTYDDTLILTSRRRSRPTRLAPVSAPPRT
jgi:hypothetical protein